MRYGGRVMRSLLVLSACGLLAACDQGEAPPPPALGPIAFAPEPEPVTPVPAGGDPAPAAGDPVDPAPAPGDPAPAGGDPADPDPSAGPAQAPAAAPCPEDGPSEGQFTADVTWSNVRSTQSCFFFSGPGGLGRDDHLGTSAQVELSAERATVDLGGARFAGRTGERVSVSRVSTHRFSGGRWRVTERIVGRWAPGNTRYENTPCTRAGGRTIRARYSYQECDTSHPEACPGHCTIEADVTLRLR